jgi:hypothetical protein
MNYMLIFYVNFLWYQIMMKWIVILFQKKKYNVFWSVNFGYMQ